MGDVDDGSDEYGLFADNASVSSCSSCDSEFIRELEAHAVVQGGDEDDDGWVDACEEVDKKQDKELDSWAVKEAGRKQREYEASIIYMFDMFTKARYVDKDKEATGMFFYRIVCKQLNLALLTDQRNRSLVQKNIVDKKHVANYNSARMLVAYIMRFDDKYPGVLCTYHPTIEKKEHGFRPYGGSFVRYEEGWTSLANYRRGARLANMMLIAFDYERFVERAKSVIPEMTARSFANHQGMWESFAGWYELRFGTRSYQNNALGQVFFRELHLANTLRNINRSLINMYYGGDATRYSTSATVTMSKLRRESPWMINDYGTGDELEVLHRLERYVSIDAVAAVPTAFDIVNWENLYWYNKFPLEAIIAFEVVEPYRYMIKQVLHTIEDPDRSYFFRKHLEGPDLPDQYTLPIIPKDHFMEDVAGAWVWDVAERGGVECSAWQCYCRDTMHPCVNIVFEDQDDDDWYVVDLVVPSSIGFDVVRKFKSGKLKSQTKE